MRNSKFLAGCVACVILLPSLWAGLPLNARYKGWYWPFIDYPMYSKPHYRGESFPMHELRVRPCAADSSIAVDHLTLGFRIFRFWRLLHSVADERPGAAEARQHLATAIRRKLPEPACGAEVWERRYVLGEEGLVDRDPPLRMIRRWELAE